MRLLEKVNKSQIRMIAPVGYYSMLKLIKKAEIVLTDSGGIQKEAFWLGTQCITLRENTEWIETINHNMNQLVGADPEKIKNALIKISIKKIKAKVNPYNFGGASIKIVRKLKNNF